MTSDNTEFETARRTTEVLDPEAEAIAGLSGGTAQYLLRKDRLDGAYEVSLDDATWVPASAEDVAALAATEDDLFEVDRGHTIVCQTLSFEYLDTLVNGYGD